MATEKMDSPGDFEMVAKRRTWPVLSGLAKLIARSRVPEAPVLILTAIFIGLGTGLGAVLFIWLLRQINSLSTWLQGVVGVGLGVIGGMALAGLSVGVIVDRWAREAKGHGVPEVMEAMVVRGGRIRPRVAAFKVLASAITIGSGGSAGREGPIVQVGAALGSTIGQMMRFSNERVRTLVACGAAAGISATFNAPIAGAIFALEVVLGRFTIRHFGSVVISSVSASIIGRIFLGDQPAFSVPAYPMNHLGEIPIYLLLGGASAIVAVGFIRVLYWLEGFFDGWSISLPIKAALGMSITGAVALLLPGREVLGPGLDLIGETIAEDFSLPLGFMAALLILKLLATSFTLGSGNSGGVFAPSLFMGAVLGGMVGSLTHSLWPEVVLHPGAYAIVGMASVFAGAARAPITAVLIVFEMSNDYRLILPLMLASVISTFLAEALFTESIYTFKLKLKGISLQSGRDVDVLQGVTVEEAMTRQVDSVAWDITLDQLSAEFLRTRHHGLAVLDKEGKLGGIVTVTDLDRAISDGLPQDSRVVDIATPRENLVVAFRDEHIGEILARMGIRGFGRLPVVSRTDHDRLAGMVRREDIIKAYNLAMARRAELQQRTKILHLRNLDGMELLEVTLLPEDDAVGKTLGELAIQLPQESVLISVRRGSRVLIPHGDTLFHAGDQLTVFLQSQDVQSFKEGIRGDQDSTRTIESSDEAGAED